MKTRVVVLGAGFGGLEFTTLLSEAIGDQIDLTLIDKNESFVFGFSKLDVMFGRETPGSVRLPYRKVVKPGVRFRQETITKIDPSARRVTTDRTIYDADVLVVALGADYDPDATPGLVKGGNEFYSVEGAERVREILPTFLKGHAIVGVTSSPFKCPPAPSEAALLLHDYLVARGVRGACKISLVMPFEAPVPSPASRALLSAFAERDITFVPNRVVRSLDPKRHVAVLDNGKKMPYDLFLGVPKHRVPDVVAESGMTEDGWIPVDPTDLRTRYPGVYAFGDVADAGVPKAGVFAEGAARVAAKSVIAGLKAGPPPPAYEGKGACYIEFGSGRVARVDMTFLSAPSPMGKYFEASAALAAEKHDFRTSRQLRWFGR
jgi:sulfide:quinone oxidoreductase